MLLPYRFLPSANKALHFYSMKKYKREKMKRLPAYIAYYCHFLVPFLKKIWHIFLHRGDGNLTNTNPYKIVHHYIIFKPNPAAI